MANKLNKNDRELLIFLAEYRLLTINRLPLTHLNRNTLPFGTNGKLLL